MCVARLCPVAGTVECAADLGVLPLAMHGNVSRVWQTSNSFFSQAGLTILPKHDNSQSLQNIM